MTNQEIFDLLSRFEQSSIRTMKIRNGDFSLEVSKEMLAAAEPEQPAAAPTAPPSAPSGAEASIDAPLAGVFYAASEPGAKPYAAVGDRVQAGQTVCLMEAMKMISEIPAPCDCIITAILKQNAQLAAYGEPLFRYRPC